MAQFIHFLADETPATVRVMLPGVDTLVDGGTGITQYSTAPGWWRAEFDGLTVGQEYVLFALNSAGAQVCDWRVRITAASGAFVAYQHAAAPTVQQIQAGRWYIDAVPDPPELVVLEADGVTEHARLPIARATSDGTVITGVG